MNHGWQIEPTDGTNLVGTSGYLSVYLFIYLSVFLSGHESKLCMERSAVFRAYGTKGLRNWSCSGPLKCDEI